MEIPMLLEIVMLAVLFFPLRKVPENGGRRRQKQTNKGENDRGGRLERGKESNTAIEEERKWREGRRERGKQKKRDKDISMEERV